MRSSSSLIRGDHQDVELRQWSPADFGQESLLTKELIQASAASLFGLQELTTKEKNRNLIKAGQQVSEERAWILAEMTEPLKKETQSATASWAPFIEQPNPKKIADRIFEEAQQKADEIIENANETADQIRQEAYNQGLENAKAETRETLQAATAVINVAREWRNDMMKQAEPMIMDLVVKMAQKMFGEGLVLDDVTLQRHFADVLESARSLGDLRVYMNPLDAKTLGPDWREYQASVLGHQVEIVSNDSIRRGGCYIQGEWGTADALVETQLNAILNQFSEVGQPEKGDE